MIQYRLQIILYLFTLSHSMVTATVIDSHCYRDTDCNPGANDVIRHRTVTSFTNPAICVGNRCKCPAHHLQVNGTACLPGRLLGFKCSQDSQCRVRVPMSGCVQGVCQCSAGYSAYRRSNCLKAAKVGMTCRTQGQCRDSSPDSYCNFSIPRVLGHCACTPEFLPTEDGSCQPRKLGLGSVCTSSRQCNLRVLGSVCQNNKEDDPSDVLHNRITAIPGRNRDPLLRKPKSVCVCPKGHLTEQGKCISVAKDIGVLAISLGQKCTSSTQCQNADPNSHCNSKGVCDCSVRSRTCSADNTGCYKDSFQCISNGECISSHFVCDGHPHCTDNSDESNCHGKRCSPLSFRCSDGVCISRGKICDGKKDCEDGADEAACRGRCPKSTYRCSDGTCLPGYVFCNATPSCSDGSDENHDACIVGNPTVEYCPFRCNNGRCRSVSVLCSGKDGCGDNSDEIKCQVCACPAG